MHSFFSAPVCWARRQAALAVDGVNELALAHQPQPIACIQGSCPAPTHGHTLLFQRSIWSSAIAGVVVGRKSGFQLNADRVSAAHTLNGKHVSIRKEHENLFGEFDLANAGLGFTKVRYERLAKNTVQLTSCCYR